MATLKRTSAARVVLVLCLLFGWVASGTLWSGEDITRDRGLATLVPLHALSDPVAWQALTVLLLIALLGFALRLHEDLAGWVALAVMGLGSTMEMSVRDVFMPGLAQMLAVNVLAGWLLGRLIGRDQSASERDHQAHELVCGFVGAILLLTAISKLWGTGLAWFDGRALSLVIYERSFESAGVLSSLRQTVAHHPMWVAFGATTTWLVEAAGIVFIWPGARKAYALALIPIFGGFAVLMGMVHPTWVALPMALAWSELGTPVQRAS